MLFVLTLEASQPSGALYRLAFGCDLRPAWASMVAALARLI